MTGSSWGVGALLICAGAAAEVQAQAVDWSSPPAVGEPALFTPPAVEEHRLSNGLRVYVVHREDVPIVQVNAILCTGAIDEPPGKAGLAQLTASLLRSGAGGRTSEEVSRQARFLGAELTTQVTAHSIEAHLRAPVSTLEPSLELLASAVLEPELSEASFLILQRRWADALDGRSTNSIEVANSLFRRALFGDHAYGRFSSGTAEGMRAIELDDVREFHRRATNPARSALVVVGAVQMAELAPKLEDLFGARWPGDGSVARGDPPAPAAPAPGLYVIDSPNASQSIIRIAQRMPERSSPDHHALGLLNFVLGGSTTSRLGRHLRETLGVTYGARSDFASFPAGGYLVAWSNVETAATGVAVSAILAEMKRLRAGVTEDEVALGRDHLVMAFPAPFMTVGGVAQTIGNVLVDGLPVEALHEYATRVAATSARDVSRAARAHLRPDEAAIVVVGDLTRIRGQLSDLGLGPATELTAEQALGTSPLSGTGQPAEPQ